MKAVKLYVVLVIALGLLLSACGSPEPVFEEPQPVDSIDGLMTYLTEAGYEVSLGDSLDQPFFSVTGVLINVGDDGVQAFEFDDQVQAQAEADLVAPDGSSVGTSMPFWVAPPHFFRVGKLIVLYTGSDAQILSTLESILGPQFAGQ